jgi:hypothetical protein
MRSALFVVSVAITGTLVGCASTEEKPADAPAPVADQAPAAPQGPPPEGKVGVVSQDTTIEPDGGYSRGTAARVALEGTSRLKDCYEEALRGAPALQLDVKMSVKIDGEGRPTLTAVDGGEVPADMRGCLEKVVQDWPYEWPTGGNEPTVTYRVTFEPVS